MRHDPQGSALCGIKRKTTAWVLAKLFRTLPQHIENTYVKVNGRQAYPSWDVNGGGTVDIYLCVSSQQNRLSFLSKILKSEEAAYPVIYQRE